MRSTQVHVERRSSVIPKGWITDRWGHPRPPAESLSPELERLWELREALMESSITRYDTAGVAEVCAALREAAGLAVDEAFETELGERVERPPGMRVDPPGLAKRQRVAEIGKLAITLSRDGVASTAALERGVALLEELVHPWYR